MPATLEIQEAAHREALHRDTRLWLRLFSCHAHIERHLRQSLHVRFGITLARFDYLAQLERHPDGLRMQALSEKLMVTGGNITGLTDQLEQEGLVERRQEPEDRRAWRVCLTDKGQAQFSNMAAEHEGWLNALFAGMPEADKNALHTLLGRLRAQVLSGQNPPDKKDPQ